MAKKWWNFWLLEALQENIKNNNKYIKMTTGATVVPNDKDCNDAS